MGEVYRADDLKLGQTVALKFLPKDFCDDPERLAYFHSEVRLARQVSHPNVCRVYDIGEVDGQHFLSMEYVDGEDLAALMRRIGRLPSDKGVEIARQLCAGLAAAHDKGVLHRDLKPANVMLDGRGRVRIMDFGLARLTDEEGARGVRAGTPAYMAPEQAAGRDITERSDLYSLGLLLYEVFTGRSVASLKTSLPLPNPSSIVPDMDSAVERVLLRCLEVDPGQRPSSAWAVASALPGSDPLLAALATGETPSPEMVAAAGSRAGLSVRTAVACLGIVAVGLVLACVLANSANVVNRVELGTSTHLREIARTFLDRNMGLPMSDLADQADGFTLTNDRSDPIHYWYRRRPGPLVPTQGQSTVALSGNFGTVEPNWPPLDVAEEVTVELDGAGYLICFTKVPPAHYGPQMNSDVQNSPTDWQKWFPEELIGFRLNDLSEDRKYLEGRPLPEYPYDDIHVWKRTGNDSKDDQYVLVATFQGEPNYFEVGPWDQQLDSPPRTEFFAGLILLLLPIVAVLAFRNYRSGRVDRRTVAHVAVTIFILGMFVYILSAHHHLGASELGPLMVAMETSAFLAVFFGLWYSGLEPVVRKIWPQTLITWTRACAGQFPDALVGRDLLLGTVFGLLHLLIVQLGTVIPLWAGRRVPDLAVPHMESLLGWKGGVSAVLQLQLDAFWICSFCLALLALLRQVLRREALAIAAIGVIDALGLVVYPYADLGAASLVLPAVSIGIAWSLHAFVVVRFGFLAFLVAWMTVSVLLFLPLTTHLAPPLLGGCLVGLGFVVTTAMLGFDMTLGGRPHRAVLHWIRGG